MKAVLSAFGRTVVRPYFAIGLGMGVALTFILFTQIRSFEVIVAALLLAPLGVLFLFVAPRRTLLAALVLAIPFNPAVPITQNNAWSTFHLDLVLYTSDLVLLALFCFVVLTRVFRRSRQDFVSRPAVYVALPLILWILAGALSVIPATERSLALIELARMVRLLAIFVAIYWIAENPSDLRFVLYCLLIAFSIQSLLVLIEVTHGARPFRLPGTSRQVELIGSTLRAGGTMGHSSNYAKLSALCLPILLATTVCAKDYRSRFLSAVFLVLGLVALATTVSRAGIGSSVLALGWIAVLLVKGRRITLGTAALGLTFLVVGLLSAWTVGGDSLMDRMQDDGGSSALRPMMFGVAANVIRARPLFGVGLNNYTYAASRFDPAAEGILELMPQPVHNIYLLQASEIGVLGAAFFVWFILRTALHAFAYGRKTSPTFGSALATAVGVGILCCWLQGMTGWGHRGSVVHTSYLAVIAGLLAAWRYRWSEFGKGWNEADV